MAEKKKKSSEDERRDSPRVPMSFLVRDVGLRDGEWEERQGDLSLGGISWRGKTAPHGTEVDVRFRLPLVPKEVRARRDSPREGRGRGHRLPPALHRARRALRAGDRPVPRRVALEAEVS